MPPTEQVLTRVTLLPFHEDLGRWDLLTLHLSSPPILHPSLSCSVPQKLTSIPTDYISQYPCALVSGWDHPMGGSAQRSRGKRKEPGVSLPCFLSNSGSHHWQGLFPSPLQLLPGGSSTATPALFGLLKPHFLTPCSSNLQRGQLPTVARLWES